LKVITRKLKDDNFSLHKIWGQPHEAGFGSGRLGRGRFRVLPPNLMQNPFPAKNS